MSVQSPTPPLDTTEVARLVKAVVSAAADRLRAETNDDAQQATEAQQALIAATTRAMSAGVRLAEIAAAEQTGHARVQEEMGKDLLRAVERAHKRRKEAERDEHNAIRRAARAGLPLRSIAASADAAVATIRSIARPTNGAEVSASDQADERP